MLNTPVLFLIFNRPDTTRQVFAKIREIQPRQLFIAADGPRNIPGEAEKCALTRKTVMDAIDWDCEVKTLFRTENLGCGLAVSDAISWFFDSVEMGIILEDDCLPDPTFFSFCETLLDKYKNDERVSIIGGTNYQLENNTTDSYYFSIYSHIWGWATWRRTWKLYEYNITSYDKKIIRNHFKTCKETNYWDSIYKNPDTLKKINTWDYQLQYVNFKHNKISIIPNTNLVKNIGLLNGTHTGTEVPDFHFKRRFGNIEKIIHPIYIQRDYEADLYFYENMLSLPEPSFATKVKGFFYKIYQRLFI